MSLIAAIALVLGGTTTAGATAVRTKASSAVVLTTSTVLTMTSSRYAYGQTARATATVRDKAGHTSRGAITFVVDGRTIAKVALNSFGQASVAVPFNTRIGAHWVGAYFVPATNAGHSASSRATPFQVLRSNVGWSIQVPVTPTYAGRTSINVLIRGLSAVTGRVDLSYRGRTLQRQLIKPNGTLTFIVNGTWPAGNAPLTVTYEGNASFAPSTRSVMVRTSKAASVMSLSAPRALAFQAGGLAAVSVTGAGVSPSGRVTLAVDGQVRNAGPLGGGRVNLSIPGLSGGSHTLTASYPGDANHSGSSRSAVITAASNLCPVTARACVDLTHSLTWLQSGGRITYGPVPMASGRPGYRTPAGSFNAYWKDINHHSSEFNNAPMPYSVFFVGGVAFHEGSVFVESHGCIHLSHSAAVQYFSTLALGDQVAVFGYAPY